MSQSPDKYDLESVYYHGWKNRWPFDAVVSFVMSNYGQVQDRSSVRILDLGCGSGHHLRFLSEEGFQAYGVDGAQRAVDQTRGFLSSMGLSVSGVRHGLFEDLPFPAGFFDAVIDRGALVCNRRDDISVFLGEVWRTLKPGGKIWSAILHEDSTIRTSGVSLGGGDYEGLSGRLSRAGVLHFTNESQVLNLYDAFTLESLVKLDSEIILGEQAMKLHRSCWLHVTARKALP